MHNSSLLAVLRSASADSAAAGPSAPSVERTPVQLPPCIAGRITAVSGSTQLTLEDLPFDGVPDIAVSASLG